MESKCYLTAGTLHGRTVLSDSYCTAPHKVMRPFYEGNRAKVIVMTASAGILAGDWYDLRYTTATGADLEVTGQGYTKLFRTDEDCCGQLVTLTVAGGSTLRYLPKPMIPFAGSDFSGTVRAELDRDSAFVCSDIVSCGRSGSGERFQMKRLHNRMEIWLDSQLVFLDNCLLLPERFDYTSLGFWEDHTHMGTLYCYTPAPLEPLVNYLRSIPFSGRFGVSCARAGVVVRALSDSGDSIERLFANMAQWEGLAQKS